jgi:hypothetical protein
MRRAVLTRNQSGRQRFQADVAEVAGVDRRGSEEEEGKGIRSWRPYAGL